MITWECVRVEVLYCIADIRKCRYLTVILSMVNVSFAFKC